MTFLYVLESLKIYKTREYKSIEFLFFIVFVLETLLSWLVIPKLLKNLGSLNFNLQENSQYIFEKIEEIPNLNILVIAVIGVFLFTNFIFLYALALFMFDGRTYGFTKVSKLELAKKVVKAYLPFLFFQVIGQFLWTLSFSISIIPALLYKILFFYTPYLLLCEQSLKKSFKESLKMSFPIINIVFLALLILLLIERVPFIILHQYVETYTFQLVLISAFIKAYIFMAQIKLIYLFYLGFLNSLIPDTDKYGLTYTPRDFIEYEKSLDLEALLDQPIFTTHKEGELLNEQILDFLKNKR